WRNSQAEGRTNFQLLWHRNRRFAVAVLEPNKSCFSLKAFFPDGNADGDNALAVARKEYCRSVMAFNCHRLALLQLMKHLSRTPTAQFERGSPTEQTVCRARDPLAVRRNRESRPGIEICLRRPITLGQQTLRVGEFPEENLILFGVGLDQGEATSIVQPC